jgi:DNA-binding transcriptional regulator YiaG
VVEYTDEFGKWWNSLSEAEQEEINAKVILLEERGPTLGRPHADRITTSRHSMMKELRGKVAERFLRVLFAFDTQRTAVLLIGGDKPLIRNGTRNLCRSRMICSKSICTNSIRRGLRNRNVRGKESGRNSGRDKKSKYGESDGHVMKKNFNALREKMSPESRSRSQALANKYRSEMALDELREAVGMTQTHLARILKVNQAAVSKMERRTDMYVSTLQDFVKAMGGELRITAKFADGTVEINQFETLRKTAGD